jgi:hypothetical protein
LRSQKRHAYAAKDTETLDLIVCDVYRRQSGITGIRTGRSKADVDYRLPPLLVADWKVPKAGVCLLKRDNSSHHFIQYKT